METIDFAFFSELEKKIRLTGTIACVKAADVPLHPLWFVGYCVELLILVF